MNIVTKVVSVSVISAAASYWICGYRIKRAIKHEQAKQKAIQEVIYALEHPVECKIDPKYSNKK